MDMDQLIDLRPGKFWSYDAIFQMPISPGAKLVYLYLCSLASKNSTSFPSYNTIAKACSMGKRTVIEKIKELEQYKLIKKQKRITNKGQTSNLFLILPLQEWMGVQILHPGGADSARDGVQKLHPKEDIFKEDKNKRESESLSDEKIKKIKQTDFGQHIQEKHIRKLVEKYGYDEVLKACKVLSFQKAEVKNHYTYLRKILQDGGIVEPENYLDPDVEEEYKKVLKAIDKATFEILTNTEINEHWNKISDIEKEKIKQEIIDKVKEKIIPNSLPEEKRRILRKGLIAIAKVKAFKKVKQGGAG